MRKHSATPTDAAATSPAHDRIITLAEVRARFPVDRTTLYKMHTSGRFPKPVNLGVRRLGWRESDVQAWLASREAR